MAEYDIDEGWVDRYIRDELSPEEEIAFEESLLEDPELQQELEALKQPRTNVLNVPVNIMRSSGNGTPDVIIQKPDGQSVIVLDIELSSRFSQLDQIDFELSEESGERLLAWSSTGSSNGRASAVLNSESIPDGRVILAMTSPGDQLEETRLLEFRAVDR